MKKIAILTALLSFYSCLEKEANYKPIRIIKFVLGDSMIANSVVNRISNSTKTFNNSNNQPKITMKDNVISFFNDTNFISSYTFKLESSLMKNKNSRNDNVFLKLNDQKNGGEFYLRMRMKTNENDSPRIIGVSNLISIPYEIKKDTLNYEYNVILSYTGVF